MQLYDTHAHLDDEPFAGNLEKVVSRACAAGVADIVAIGTTADSSEKTTRIAERFDGVHAAVGLQPNYCSKANSEDWDRIVRLAQHPAVVALGETGLDRHWDYTPFDVQLDYFQRHLTLSQQIGLPFVVHMRDCEADILEALRDARKRGALSGVMHSFTGSADTARECLELGLYISFAGMVTFKKSDVLRAVAASIPADRLLIETDAPYLSPHPVRGQRPNEPALMVHTARCLAKVRGTELEQLASQTTANAQRLFQRANN